MAETRVLRLKSLTTNSSRVCRAAQRAHSTPRAPVASYLHDSAMRARRIAAFALAALFLCAHGWLVAAQAGAVRPVGDVVDHALPPAGEAGASVDPEGALEALPAESMQGLFNWAIENSDPGTLREMAERAERGAGTGDDASGTDAPAPAKRARTPTPNRRELTQEEMLAKREDVKEALELLASNPTEQQFIKQAVEMFADPRRSEADRALALEEMEELVAPIDNANDLHALGALAPLLAVALDVRGDAPDAVAARALGVLAVALSNNEKVADLVHSWRFEEAEKGEPHGVVCGTGAGSERCASRDVPEPRDRVAARRGRIALGDPTDTKASNAVSPARRAKALRALASLTRSHFPSRRALFAAGGADMFAALFDAEDEKTRKRAHALAADVWTRPDVAGGPAARGFPPGRRDEETRMARDLAPRLVAALGEGSSDAREKALGALEAALERVGGEAGAAARDAAAKAHAGEALARLSRFFEEAAADEPDTAEHALSLGRAAARLAGTMRAVGSAGHEEL